MTTYTAGDKVRVIKTSILPGNEIAPPLTMGEERTVIEVIRDRQGNQHLDVGIKSEVNWVTSYETSEKLPKGDQIHWCHPSRFEKV